MDENKYIYSTFDVGRILGIGRGRLVHWMKEGWIPKEHDVPWGKGFKAAFSIHDLYSIAFFKECVDFSLSRKVANRCMNHVIMKGWQNIIDEEIKILLVLRADKRVNDDPKKLKVEYYEKFIFLKEREMMERKRLVLFQQPVGFFIDLERIMYRMNIRV